MKAGSDPANESSRLNPSSVRLYKLVHFSAISRVEALGPHPSSGFKRESTDIGSLSLTNLRFFRG